MSNEDDLEKIRMCCCDYEKINCSGIENAVKLQTDLLRLQFAQLNTQICTSWFINYPMENFVQFSGANKYNSQDPENGAGLFDTELNQIITPKRYEVIECESKQKQQELK